MVVCRENDDYSFNACRLFHDADTAACTQVERDFLRGLMGGCATPISALAQMHNDTLHFEGNLLSLDGSKKIAVKETISIENSAGFGMRMAQYIIDNGGKPVLEEIRNA